MPPFAPPNGRSTSAVFHVISAASARTSSRSAERVEPDAALVRSARAVVLHAVADEDVDAAVVHADGHLHADLAVGRAQDLAHVLFETDPVGGALEEQTTAAKGLVSVSVARAGAPCVVG